MKVSVEKLEGKMAKLTVEIEPEVFEKAVDTVYKKQRGRINVPGFRKGKAPRQLIEKMYGAEIFFEDAADEVIKTEYPKAYDECGEEIVSQPEIDITQMEKGKTFIFTAEVALRPDVELGKYTGVTVTRQDVSVTEEDMEKEIQMSLRRHARTIDVTERAVENDDTVNIDYEGKLDGVPFDGGTAKGHDLKIGSGAFIPGFEEQIISHKVGEEFDIDVVFPEQYHSQELAGKAVVFTVKINSIKAEEMPELTDELVGDISEFETVAEYKEDIKNRITTRKEKTAMRQKQEEALEKIVADSKIDVPEKMIDTQVSSMMNEYARGMAGQGLSMQQYFQMTGMNAEQLMEQMRPDAEKQIRTSLVLEEIAKAENIQVGDEDIDARLSEMGAMYMIPAEDLKKNMSDQDLKNIKKEIAVEKAAEFVGNNVKERAKAKKKEEDKPAAEKKTTKKTTKKKEEK